MNKLLLLIISFCFSLVGFSQSFLQVGFDINGYNLEDNFGYSLDMDSLGNRIVIGAPNWEWVSSNSGNVRVFEWDGISWVQLGQDILGEGIDHNNGYSVTMNSTGNIIAIGAIGAEAFNPNLGWRSSGNVRVYEWDGFTWNQLGSDIDPENADIGYQFGCSISINSSGNRLAVGAKDGWNVISQAAGNTGFVDVFEWDGVSWLKLGESITGINDDDYFGHSVSMSSNGDRIIIGSPGSDTFSPPAAGDEKGLAKIYEWDGTSWIQIGQNILGEVANDWSGSSVSINSSGNIVAVSSPFAECYRGQVRIFELINSSWIQLGQIIQGDTCNDVCGWSVSLNSAGNTIIVGSPEHDGNAGSLSGHTKSYNWNNSSWEQYGPIIEGQSSLDFCGFSVSLNSLGNRFSIGSPSIFSYGLARVFENDGCNLNSTEICLLTVDSTSTKNLVVWEKPLINSVDSFLIYRESGTNNYIQVGSVAYDSLSQFVDSTNGINPNVTSYRYKISVLDTCGLESELSSFHETMFLSVNQGVNGENYLIWDAYEGFPLLYYYILRDSTAYGNWEVLDSVSSNNFIYADLNPPVSGVNYVIEVLPPNTCTSTKAQDHNSTRSNRATIVGGGGQGIFQQENSNVNIHPNPTSDQIIIDIKGYNGVVNIEVYDLQGRLLETTTNTIVSLKKHAKGIYVLKVSYGEVTEEFRVVRD